MITPTRIITFVIVLLTVILYLLKVEKELVGVIAAGMFGVAPQLVTEWKERGKTKKEKVQELVDGSSTLSPLLVALFVIFYLLFIQFSIGALIGYAVSYSLVQAEYEVAYVEEIAGLIAAFLSVILIAPIAMYATHRIKRYPFLWIIAAILIEIIINILIYTLILKRQANLYDILAILVLIIAYLPGITIGYFWAKKTQGQFVISKLFKQLAPADQNQLIDLVLTLPGLRNN